MKKHIVFAISVGLVLLISLGTVLLLTSKVSVEFTFSHPDGITLHPGSDTVYEFTLKNNSVFPKKVKISDPSDPLFTEGKVEKEIKVGGRKTAKVVYTLKTADDSELIGKSIKERTIKVNEREFNVPEVFIERTFNEWDARKIRLAILAHESAPVENATLVKWIYTVALSKAASLEGEPDEILSRIFEPEKAVASGEKAEINAEEITPASVSTIQMVAPRLYFSEHIAEEAKALLKGEPLALKDASFVAGDVFVTDEKMYIHDGEKFWLLKKDGMVKTSEEEIKNGSYTRWAVLRPSMALKNINYSTPYSKEGFSEKELAVVATAEAFLLRGMRYQYDDTRFLSNGPFRWQIRANEPEDVTLQHWGYSNCAAFALDCNRFGIGYKTNLYAVRDIIYLKPMSVFDYEPTGNETEEEKKKIEEEYLNALRPGDIICILRNSGSGHAMLYVGCGDIIHSSGGNYNYEKGSETFEPTVRFMRALDLFREDVYPTSYVFTKLKKIAVIRPSMKEETAVTENTKARLQNMDGIVAEKLSSHNKATTANVGEEITFTVSIFNTNKEEKTVEVKFEVPENTELVSGTLTQEVTVASEERVNVDFVVRPLSEGKVSGEGTTVGGVKLKCPDVQVSRTLTAEEQEKAKALIENIKNTEGNAIARVNAIYEELLGEKTTEEASLNDLRKEFFFFGNANKLTLKKSSGLAKALVPTLYGGRSLNSTQFDNSRIRVLMKEHFTIGDLLYVGDNGEYKLYIWSGEDLIDLDTAEKVENLDTFLEGILAVDEFFLGIRPSMMG